MVIIGLEWRSGLHVALPVGFCIITPNVILIFMLWLSVSEPWPHSFNMNEEVIRAKAITGESAIMFMLMTDAHQLV